MMKRIAFGQFYRLIFVLFSLYLMGDAFSRWDGFSYYAAFSEFIPSIALALILWSIVSFFAAVFVWILIRAVRKLCNLSGMRIGAEHVLLYALIFFPAGMLAWKGKKLVWPDLHTSFQVKFTVFVSVAAISALLAWALRNRAGKWIRAIFERITPLVWLFGLFVLISVPVVAYHVRLHDADNLALQEPARTSAERAERPNFILLTFDALAAREMSLYGYPLETTPFISRWAENATVFRTVEAASNFTTPAAASLMTGKRVWTHQTYHIEGTKPVRSDTESLPALLKENGYFNIAMVVNPFASVRVLGMTGSFDVAPLTSEFGKSSSLFGWKFGIVDKMLYRLFGDRIRLHNWILKNEFIFSKFINLVSRNITETTVPPEMAFDRFLGIIDNQVPQPFFAWIHIFPPHDPYLPPEPFIGSRNTSTSRELRTYKGQEQLIEESYKYLFQYRAFPEEMRPAVDQMRAYYDEFISYIDKEFGEFITELQKRDLGNTVIVLAADHGESFEHGYFTHGGPFLYEQVTHIPLVIREPGQKTGKTISPLVEQIDIPATVLDLAGIPVPSWMEGRSMVPLMRDEPLAQRPAFSMNLEGNRSRGHEITRGSIAVWEGDYKLIHYLDRNESLLFNIVRDPAEQENLISSEPEVGQRLKSILTTGLDQANKRIRHDH